MAGRQRRCHTCDIAVKRMWLMNDNRSANNAQLHPGRDNKSHLAPLSIFPLDGSSYRFSPFSPRPAAVRMTAIAHVSHESLLSLQPHPAASDAKRWFSWTQRHARRIRLPFKSAAQPHAVCRCISTLGQKLICSQQRQHFVATSQFLQPCLGVWSLKVLDEMDSENSLADKQTRFRSIDCSSRLCSCCCVGTTSVRLRRYNCAKALRHMS